MPQEITSFLLTQPQLTQSLSIIEEHFGVALICTLALSYGLGLIELIWEMLSDKMQWQRFKEILASVSVGIPSFFADKVVEGAFITLYLAIFQLIPWRVEISWISLLIAILLVDFIHYWTHRWEHQIRVLWAVHSVHHSSPVFNISTSFRVVFFRSALDIVYYIPLVLLGFHPLLVLLALAAVAVYQIWLHNDTIGKLGPIEWVFNTPSHHRVHHGSNPKYIDKNYSGILILWDRLFGTFQVEEEKPTYGLTVPIDSVNPVNVHFCELVNMIGDLRRARNWLEIRGFLFLAPGWKPVNTS